jgi:hypothetical protein
MKKVFFLMCLFFAPLAFTACSIEDNPNPEPVEPIVNVDDPNEEVTNQPAQAPGI